MPQGRPCTVCNHAKADVIERLLLSGKPDAEVARSFGLGPWAIGRHRANHMHTAEVVRGEVVEPYQSVMDRMEALTARIEKKLDWVESKGSPAAFASVTKELRNSLELIARLRRELDDAPRVNVLMLPEWHRVRETMMAALKPYSDARLAVSSALMALEEGERADSA